MTVNRGLNCDGTATRYAGFNMRVTEQVATDGAAFVAAAKAGNLCSNVHTSAFPGGEIRGQLSVVSDSGTGHNRVIELAGPLDASQEPGPTSDSTATGGGPCRRSTCTRLRPGRTASSCRTRWWMRAVCLIAAPGRYVLGQGSDPLAGQRQAHLTAGPDEKVGAQLLFHLADLV